MGATASIVSAIATVGGTIYSATRKPKTPPNPSIPAPPTPATPADTTLLVAQQQQRARIAAATQGGTILTSGRGVTPGSTSGGNTASGLASTNRKTILGT